MIYFSVLIRISRKHGTVTGWYRCVAGTVVTVTKPVACQPLVGAKATLSADPGHNHGISKVNLSTKLNDCDQ